MLLYRDCIQKILKIIIDLCYTEPMLMEGFFGGEVLDRIRDVRVDGGSRARGLSAAAGYGMDLRRF